jgi:hypothetical protein
MQNYTRLPSRIPGMRVAGGVNCHSLAVRPFHELPIIPQRPLDTWCPILSTCSLTQHICVSDYIYISRGCCCSCLLFGVPVNPTRPSPTHLLGARFPQCLYVPSQGWMACVCHPFQYYSWIQPFLFKNILIHLWEVSLSDVPPKMYAPAMRWFINF